MRQDKRLTLKRERLRTLLPAQLNRVVGAETNTESFDLNCNSYDCNTVTLTTDTGTGNTTGNTITFTDPLINLTV